MGGYLAAEAGGVKQECAGDCGREAGASGWGEWWGTSDGGDGCRGGVQGGAGRDCKGEAGGAILRSAGLTSVRRSPLFNL